MEASRPKVPLQSLTLAQLRALVAERGLPEYRYRQMARWLWDRGVDSLEEMTDLSKELREELAREYEVGGLSVAACRESSVDGSAKFLFRLPGGGSVESVLMPAPKRITMCISSQVGCTLDCIFCQTGRMGFYRNLAPHEIVGQVVPLWKRIRAVRTRTNIVFMGMGEPLHNVDSVVEACRLLMDPLGYDLGPGRITVSTAGVVPGIRKLAASGLNVRLALSLNATTQSAREMLMPKAAKTPLSALLETAREYARITRNRVTVEYVLMKGVNDSEGDADRLAALLRGGPFKINVIPYNPGASPELERPDRDRVDWFAKRLWPQAPVVTVRWSQGPDIAAACGQLHTEVEGAPRGGRSSSTAGTGTTARKSEPGRDP
ncbi:MAG TPA: 23S rRNA (adenine(2503)-C(2))-methyltransferase RlmN [bacterium]|nr:23S rRNA (adenine(2503)-C(2))-methyltransferase RlmN [bacterium]